MIFTREKIIPPLIAFLAALCFSIPILLNWNYIGPRDWELFTTMADIPVRTVLEYHQFPFWNPYIGGGNILFVHPEAAVFSPFFIVQLIFGAVGGLKIQVLMAWFLGFWGSYLFARRLGLSEISSWAVSFSYFGSSYFALHFGAGHIPFTHFCFLPWLAYFLLKAEDNPKYIFAGAMTVAMIILGNGAAIPFLYTSFFIGIFVVLYSIQTKRYTIIKYYLVSIIIGVLLSSVKFIPMYLELSQFPWEGRAEDFTPIHLIPSIFFSFDQYLFKNMGEGYNWPWHEYGAYLSPLVLVLALIGIIRSFRKSWVWIAIGLFFLIFGLGNFGQLSPWNMFMKLPGFASIRAPGRAFQFTVLAFSILGGIGLDYLIEKLKLKFGTVKKIAIAIPLIILTANFLINLPGLSNLDYKLPAKYSFNDDFRQDIGGVEQLYSNFQRNRGCLIAPWLSAYKPSRGIVSPNNEVKMEYVTRGSASVVSRRYTPNQVEYSLNAETDGSIVLSIGYDKGWYTKDGRSISEQQGLVAVDFKRGGDNIVLNYRTPGFYLYLSLSLVILAGILILLIHPKACKRFKTIF